MAHEESKVGVYHDKVTGRTFEKSWMHPNIVAVKDQVMQGTGLKCTGPINQGEPIWKCSPDEQAFWFEKSDIDKWSKEDQEVFWVNAYQVRTNPPTWSGIPPWVPRDVLQDISDYMNHSCEPTTWFEGEYLMTARMDLQEGDEITYHYGTSETEDSKHVNCWDCNCGTAACQKRVTGGEWKDSAFQERFKGHFTPDVQARIDGQPVQDSPKPT